MTIFHTPKKLTIGAFFFVAVQLSPEPARAQETTPAASADSVKLLKHLHKRYNKGPIPLDRVESVVRHFVNTGNAGSIEPGQKPERKIIGVVGLKHYVEDGPFLWGTFTEDFTRPWTKAGKRVREICEDKFGGTITILPVTKLRAMAKAGQLIPIPSRNNEEVPYPVISDVAYLTGSTSYNIPGKAGIYTCNISEGRRWSVHVGRTRFIGRNRVSPRQANHMRVVSILPLDVQASPVFEKALLQHYKDQRASAKLRIAFAQEDKRQALKRQAQAERDKQDRQIQIALDNERKIEMKASLRPGTQTNCGMVVEINNPVILVQPSGLNTVAQWVHERDLDISGKDCHVLNKRGFR